MSNIHAELENVTAKLVVDNVSKTFNSAGGKVEALKNVSLKVGEGEFVCLVGPSGCGKSTLLNLIAGLDKPDSGTIKVDDTVVTGPGRDRMVMFQEHALFPWLDVFDNVMFGLRLKPNLTNPERKEVAKFYLHLVGLDKFAHSAVHELSGGMRQRVALARSLAPNPRILLMTKHSGPSTRSPANSSTANSNKFGRSAKRRLFLSRTISARQFAWAIESFFSRPTPAE